jgi:hypothetical protein
MGKILPSVFLDTIKKELTLLKEITRTVSPRIGIPN